MSRAQTLYDKIWESHKIAANDGVALLYIDRHLVHEVTSPQAFEGLSLAGRDLWRAGSILAVPDHNVPTKNRAAVADPISRLQIETLDANCEKFGVREIPMNDPRQGIVHIIGPEQGLTLPGLTVVCGDSHTSTHGAFGCLAFGIGTTEIEHVMATQCLPLKKSRSMRITVDGKLRPGVGAKDVILAIIGKIGAAGASGYVVEYAGEAVRAMSMSARMTICNMSIEAGARAGMIAVDDKTIEYVKGRPLAPRGEMWARAVDFWRGLKSDEGAVFDREESLRADDILPQVSWGTSPDMVAPITGETPDPAREKNPVKRESVARALEYMDLRPGVKMTEIELDQIFIGSCTNARLDDLRAAADIVRGKKIAVGVKRALVVPGSGLVRRAAEEEGIDRVFIDAGFEWREAGCSMCLGMNEDKLGPGERCASTSNRNFEGRQGYKGRTHLVSPPMAAAAAIAGRFVDISARA